MRLTVRALRCIVESTIVDEGVWVVQIAGRSYDGLMKRGEEPILFVSRDDAAEAADAWNMSSNVEMGFAEPIPLKGEVQEGILHEATCPGCGDPDAYVGLSDVECPNRKCTFFSKKQAQLTKGTKKSVPTRLELKRNEVTASELRKLSDRASKRLWEYPFDVGQISKINDEFWAGSTKGLLRWDPTLDGWTVADGPNEGYAFLRPQDVIDRFGDEPLKELRSRGANSYITRYRWDDGKLSLHPDDGSGIDEVLIWDDRGKKWV